MIYLDEANINCAMRKNYGRSKSGLRVVNSSKVESQLSLTILASIDWEGELNFICIDGSCKSKDFVGFISQIIRLKISLDDLEDTYFFCDNASIHKSYFL